MKSSAHLEKMLVEKAKEVFKNWEAEKGAASLQAIEEEVTQVLLSAG